jgi:hypothetical protein
MYHGGFERNFPNLKPGTNTFEGTDGAEHALPDAPSSCDGLRIFYMEKAGKKFAAVRVQHAKDDLILKKELLLDPGRHMGFGKRFSAEPTEITDEFAAVILEDMMQTNTDQRRELVQLRSRFSITGAKK